MGPTIPLDTRDVPEKILVLMDEMLLLVQDFEGFLTFVIDAVGDGEKEQARANLLHGDPRTFGRLLTLLRRKVTLTPSFDALALAVSVAWSHSGR